MMRPSPNPREYAHGGVEDGVPFIARDTTTVVNLARQCTERQGGSACDECHECHMPYAQCCCLELFRRAIVENDSVAWTAVYAQYGGIVRHWLGASAGTIEADEDVMAVFERFWHAVDGAKFARFPSLAAVLQYLKLCAHAVRMDRARSARTAALTRPLDDSAETLTDRDDVMDIVIQRLDAAGFWDVVHGVVGDERERMVLYLSFVIGLTPGEIRAHHARQFPRVADVYRLKRNMLDRLRRAPEIQTLSRAP